MDNVEKRIEEILEVIRNSAAGDFSKSCEISDANDSIDGLAMGINMMAEDFQCSMLNLKKSEQFLLESEARYKAIFEGSAEGILVVDLETRKFIYANRAFSEMFGYSLKELKKMDVEMFYPGEVLPWIIADYKTQAREGKTLALEIPCIKKNGRITYADINSSLMEMDGRNCSVGFFRDATARMMQERERAELRDQLRHSQKMEAVGTLVGGVAHDFNNLITTIMGYAMFLAKSVKDKDPDMYRDLNEIKEAAERAARLVSQLLMFSRKKEVNPEVLDMSAILENVKNLIERAAGEKIEVAYEVDESIWKVEVDKGNVEQILMNLVINARDAIRDQGGIVVSLKNVQVKKESTNYFGKIIPGKYVVLEVRDTGSGIQPEHLVRIFDPFFTTKEVGKGTGLGLSVVNSIVEGHNGWVSVDSRPGKGTRFKIGFPVLREMRESRIPQAESDEDLSGNGEHILIVEDEDGVRKLLERVLQEAGYTVQPASGFEEACRYREQNPKSPDLIISDVVLPDGSGLDLAKKAIEEKSRIILCSGYTDENLKLEEIKKQGVPFFRKPFDGNEVLAMVKRLLVKKEK